MNGPRNGLCRDRLGCWGLPSTFKYLVGDGISGWSSGWKNCIQRAPTWHSYTPNNGFQHCNAQNSSPAPGGWKGKTSDITAACATCFAGVIAWVQALMVPWVKSMSRHFKPNNSLCRKLVEAANRTNVRSRSARPSISALISTGSRTEGAVRRLAFWRTR